MPRFSDEAQLVLVAVQFLTRLPVPQPRHYSPAAFEAALRYLPLGGLIVGLLSAAAYGLASRLWTAPLAALLAVATAIVLTGALHEDGFADFFDALGGSTKEARLAIMKDSRIGTYGALALGTGLAVKVLAISSLPLFGACAAAIAAHSGGRLAAVLTIWAFPYAARAAAAKIAPAARPASAVSLAVALSFGISPALLLGLAGLAAFLLAVAAAALIALLARRLIGGYTGDVLGAVEQTFEIAFLLCAAAFA